MLWVPGGDRVLNPASGLVGRGMGALGRFTESGVVVPTDGPNAWYRPTSSAEWAALGLNVPDYLALCQDASGDLVPTIDGLSMGNLVKNGSTGHVYNQSVSGWSATFAGLTTPATADRWSAALSVASGESLAVLVYMAIPGSTGREFLLISGSGNRMLSPNIGTIRANHNAVAVTSTIDHSDSTVRQFLWFRNAATDVSGAETDLESLPNTHSEAAMTSADVGIGARAGVNPEAFRCCLFAIWKGANAEFDPAAMLTTLRD